MSIKRTKILGVGIDNLGMDEVLEKVESFLKDNRQRYVVTPNPEFLVRAQQDKKYRSILNQADLAVPDGAGLIYASKFLGSPLRERITGVDLMDKICQKAAQKKYQVFLFGAKPKPEVALKTAEVLKNKYSGLKIDLLGPGDKKTPTILFVALGSPKQEKWISHYLKKMSNINLAVGVGGAFDLISGRIKRAPVIVQKAGLEWLWRLANQPWRAQRVFKAVIVFPWLVLKEKVLKSSKSLI